MARREDAVSVAEISALTARLRALSAAGADADRAEREAFLTDKDALIDRITHPEPADPAEHTTTAEQDDRAGADGWVMVDPSEPGGVRAMRGDEYAALLDRVRAGQPAPGHGQGARGVDDEARRDQLARWHHDDARSERREAHEYGDDGAGWAR